MFIKLLRLLFLTFLLLQFQFTLAQLICPCLEPVDNIYVGCAPFTLKVRDCSGSAVEKSYSYGGSFTVNDTIHTFNAPGVYKAIQAGNFTCGGTSSRKYDTIEIVVKATPLPQLTGYSCANNKALVIASDPQYDEYFVTNAANTEIKILKGQSAIIDRNTNSIPVRGNYQGSNCGNSNNLMVSNSLTLGKPTITSISTSTNGTIAIQFLPINEEFYELQMRESSVATFTSVDSVLNGASSIELTLDGLQKNYCFRMRAFDRCGQSGDFSDEICTTLLSGSALNKQNNIQWNQPHSLAADAYSLNVNNTASAVFNNRTEITSFVDTNIVCGGTYCYQVTATLPNSAKSISNPVCLKAVSNEIPPPLTDLSSTIASNKPVLSWGAPATPVTNYTLSFATDRSSYSFLANVTTVNYVDVAHDPSQNRYCYRLTYTDRCGNTSPLSNATCPIFLQGRVNTATNRQLFWQPYSGGPNEAIEYFVEKIDANGNVYQSVQVGSFLAYEDKGLDTLEQTVRFRIKGVSQSGKVTYSNIWEAQQKGNFFMPNAFSPNGDGLNDVFHAEGLFIVEFNMEIWDKNGDAVFVSKSFKQGWDGTVNGQPAPVGTYMYKVDATDRLGTSYKRNGTLQLLK